MQPGQLVGPIEVPGGFSILYLIDKRQVLMPIRAMRCSRSSRYRSASPGTLTEAQATRPAPNFANAMRAAKGCGAVDAVAAQLGAQVVSNDQVRARDLPGPLQEALLSMSIGEASPPFGSIKEGVRVLMLCGRDDPKATGGPSFDELHGQMEDDRVNKRAQTYLRDLRRDAIIEYN
jgi:peptidyl-prolyl cis-trans isomerase SurA